MVESWPGGWLAIDCGALLRRRRKLPPAREVKATGAPPDEKAARSLVIQSAGKNDPGATRQALRQWCRILYPELTTGAYEKFLSAADPSLNQQLEALDRHLYGSSAGGWSGEALAEMIMKWQKEEIAHNHDKLPDLYPRS